MKLILKDNTEFSIVRVNKNIINTNVNSEYKELANELGVSQISTSTILFNTMKDSSINLFDIEHSFTYDNISEITFITEDGNSIKETYNAVGKIYQNLSDFVNETTIILLQYQ